MTTPMFVSWILSLSPWNMFLLVVALVITGMACKLAVILYRAMRH